MRRLLELIALSFILLFSAAPDCFSQTNIGGTGNEYREELTVVTDRDIYVAGEKIYLKIFKLDRTDHTPDDVSKVAYAQLIDSYKNSAAQAKISLMGISGAGEITIPDTIPTGNYFICTSTSWMQNFSPELYSYKRISVINPFETPDVNKLLPSDRSPDSIAFYPESGKMVSGLNNHIGCRGYDRKGFPVPFNGSIIGNNGTTCKIKAGDDGIVFFDLKPKPGETFYLAIEKAGADPKRFNLPPTQESGSVLSVKTDHNNLIVAILRHENSDSKNSKSTLLYSPITGEPVKRTLSESDTLVYFRKTDIPEGFAVLTLSDNKGRSIADRWVYNERTTSVSYDVKLQNAVYYPREKVNLTVEVKNLTGIPSGSDLLVSVVKSFSLDKNNPGNYPEYSQLPFLASISQDLGETSINNYLVLCPGLNAIFPIKSSSKQAEEVHKLIDDLKDMLASDSSQIDTLKGKLLELKEQYNGSKRNEGYSHLPELEGHLVSGRMLNMETGLPLRNENVILSFVGSNSNCSFATTNENGVFYFNTRVTGLRELVIQPASPCPEGYFVEMDNPFPEAITKEKMPVFFPDTNMLSRLNQAIISMQVKGIYDPYRMRAKQAWNSVSLPDFYGEQLEKIYVEKYIELNSLKEIIKEIVPALWIGKRDKKSYFWLASEADSPPFKNDPLVLVDGVPVNDIEKILSINPKELERIELLRKRYYIADLTFDGIVHFITKKANLSAIEFDKTLFRQEFQSVQNMPAFYSPDYSADSLRNSRIPDFRNTLYWNPSVVTDKKGNASVDFFTPDEPGEYSVVVEGMTSKGNLIRKEVKFVVVDRK
ncbi:MAG TPA: hypothetical protein PLR88_10175 [Bacteroidales bacterium]|nr:hypothetical protein [Bacteroidales bacterium]HPT22302.1 hypothetical protein [Bacteroidales bacterium]